jgi:hypothetical protein
MKAWTLVALAAITITICSGCAEEQPLTSEESAAQVRAANEAAMDSPTSGAANPEALSEEGP